MDDLHRFQAGEFVEEPSTTRVHEQRVALHFQQFQDGYLLLGRQRPNGVIREECFPRFFGTVENDADVVIAALPWVSQIFLELRFEDGRKPVSQPVKRSPQRSTPLLVPWVTARITPTVAAPAFHTMVTTPRTVFDNFNEVLRRILLQELAVVGKLGNIPLLDFVQRKA